MKSHLIFRIKALGLGPKDMTTESVVAGWKVHRGGYRESRNGRGCTKPSLGNACWY